MNAHERSGIDTVRLDTGNLWVYAGEGAALRNMNFQLHTRRSLTKRLGKTTYEYLDTSNKLSRMPNLTNMLQNTGRVRNVSVNTNIPTSPYFVFWKCSFIASEIKESSHILTHICTIRVRVKTNPSSRPCIECSTITTTLKALGSRGSLPQLQHDQHEMLTVDTCRNLKWILFDALQVNPRRSRSVLVRRTLADAIEQGENIH